MAESVLVWAFWGLGRILEVRSLGEWVVGCVGRLGFRIDCLAGYRFLFRLRRLVRG